MATEYRVKNPRPNDFRPQYKGFLGLWWGFVETYHSYAGSCTETMICSTLEEADAFLEKYVAEQKQKAEYKALLKKDYPKVFRWPRLNIEKMG